MVVPQTVLVSVFRRKIGSTQLVTVNRNCSFQLEQFAFIGIDYVVPIFGVEIYSSHFSVNLKMCLVLTRTCFEGAFEKYIVEH